MTIVYLILIAVVLYLSFKYDRIEETDPHKTHRLWVVCIMLISITGFSYGLGGDKFVYIRDFELYPTKFGEVSDYMMYGVLVKGQMPLWVLVNLFAKVVFNSFYVVQLLQAAAINIAVCSVAKKYTNRVFLFVLIYFLTLQYFIFNTEVMREGFALGFCLFAIEAYFNGKKLKFAFLVFVGMMFHVSAFVILLFPFIKFKVSKRSLVYAFGISVFVWMFSDFVLSKIIMAVLGGMGAFVEKVLYYSLKASTIFGFLRCAIIYLIIPFIVMYFSMQIDPSEDAKERKRKLIGFQLVLGVLACSFAGFARFFNYVQVFYLVMLADFVYKLFSTERHLLIRVWAICGIVLSTYLQYTISYKSTGKHYYDFFVPYTCILDEDRSVFVREISHKEAVLGEKTEKNVREVE